MLKIVFRRFSRMSLFMFNVFFVVKCHFSCSHRNDMPVCYWIITLTKYLSGKHCKWEHGFDCSLHPSKCLSFALEVRVDMLPTLKNDNSYKYCHLQCCDATLSASHQYTLQSSALLIDCAKHLRSEHHCSVFVAFSQ